MSEHASRLADLSGNEPEYAEQHPRVQILYETIRLEGEHELDRLAAALAWSGLTAGMSMGVSLLALGLLRARLPDAQWFRAS